jgi:hypothetical protein
MNSLSLIPELNYFKNPYFIACQPNGTCIAGRATLKMLRRKSKTQFVKQERNTQNGIALFNYLKHICAATINANNESFHQNI